MRSWLSLGGLGVRIVESRVKSESGEKSKEEEREREWAEMRNSLTLDCEQSLIFLCKVATRKT